MTPRASARSLVLADSAVIFGFTLVGMLSHGRAITVAALLRDSVPLLGGWLGAAMLFGLYGRSSWRRLVGVWSIPGGGRAI